MEEIYVVKVRTEPDPSRLYPSERRYSALTVGGLGAVHLLLAATSLLFGSLGLALQSDSCWTGRYGGGLWLGIAAAAAGASGILAWRRWYVDNNIRWFFISSTVAATTALLCLVITAAALAAIEEQRTNQDLYKSIYYDQGFVQPTDINDFRLPSLSLHDSDATHERPNEFHANTEDIHYAPPTSRESSVNNDNESKSRLTTSSEQIISVLNENNEKYKINNPDDQKTNSDNLNSSQSTNINLEDVSIDDIEDENIPDTIRKEEEIRELDDVKEHDPVISYESKVKDDKEESDAKSKTSSESTHIMKIAKGNKSANNTIDPALLSTLKDHTLNPSDYGQNDYSYNRTKKSTDGYQSEESENNEYQRRIIIEEEQIQPKIIGEDDAVDMTTMSSSKDGSQAVHNVLVDSPNNLDSSNHTLLPTPTPKQNSQQDQPHYEKILKGDREVRTVVAINILVASALELAWSLLSAHIAWKGMKNGYPHDNATNSCERTVEGLERSPPPPPPSSNDTYDVSNKRHHKMDDVFRKPDIISNHRHCHSGKNHRMQNKNGINKLMINTVSERINAEPYLPLEESTMEYQERVQRFLASNNVAANNSDSASNVDSGK